MPIAALVTFCIVPALGYQCSKLFDPLRRTIAFVCLALFILALPSIDHGSSLRWWESLLSFGIFLKTAALGFSGLPLASRIHAFIYFSVPMAGLELHEAASTQVALERLFWGLAKVFLCFLALVINSLEPRAFNPFWIQMIVANLVVCWGISGAVDAHAGCFMLLTRKYLPPFADSPLISSSPRDFWSRRWNLLFKNTVHTVVFSPLRNRGISPIFGVLVVFAVSSILHEYMVFISSPEKTYLLGNMTLFFLLQSGATVVETALIRPSLGLIPAFLRRKEIGVVLTWFWMISVSPLFFVPALQCIPFLSWRLWD